MTRSISQLDLVLLGRRGLTARLSGVERAIRDISIGVAQEAVGAVTGVRPNLLSNASFEFYNRGETLPNEWTIGGGAAVVVGVPGAEGGASLNLPTAGSAAQGADLNQSQRVGAATVSVAVRATAAATVALTITHGSATAGPLMRLDADGQEVETNAHPGDGNWYRFFRQYLLNAVGTASVSISAVSGSVTVDAIKYEREDGAATYIEPTAFVGGDWGAAVQIRDLKAENIVTGTLTVGGIGSTNPRISVRDGSNVEIATVGDPTGGFRGIEVKATGGMRVSGSGDVQVTGGGKIYAGSPSAARTEMTASGLAGYNSSGVKQAELQASTGKIRVIGTGGISVENGSSVEILGGGKLVVGTPGAARTEVRDYGVIGYNASNAVIFALNEAGVVNGVNIDQGDVLIGNAGTSYAIWDNSAGTLTVEGKIFAGNRNVLLDTDGLTFVATTGAFAPRNAISWVTDLSSSGTTNPKAFLLGAHAPPAGPTIGKNTLYVMAGSLNALFFGLPGGVQEDGELQIRAASTTSGKSSVYLGAANQGGDAAELYFFTTGRRIVTRGAGLFKFRTDSITNPPFLQWESAFVELGSTDHASGVRTRGILDVRKLAADTDTRVQLEGRTAFTDLTDTFLRLNHTNSYTSGVVVTTRLAVDGWSQVGNTAIDYSPAVATWNVGGATLLLNGLNSTSIVFHDAGNRVDAIVAVAGVITIGKDIGYGVAAVSVPGAIGIGVTPLASRRLFAQTADNTNSTYSIVCTNSSGSNLMYVAGGGYSWVSAAWNVGSDVRLKEDITDVPDALARLQSVRPRSYYLRADTARERTRHYGVVAQELQSVLPELVGEGEGGLLSVRYEELIPLLVGAVQELTQQNAALSARLAKLEAQAAH